MHQIVSFIMASLMLGNGLYLLYEHVFVSYVIEGVPVISAGVLIIAGGAWLIVDFILPTFLRKARDS